MDIKTDYRLPPTLLASEAKTPTQQVKNEQPNQLGKEPLSVTGEEGNDALQLRSPEAAETESERESLQEAVSNLQDFTQSIQRSLSFSINENTGRTVVEVTDKATGELIRQLSSEDALRLAESLDEMRSLLFTAQA